MTEKVKRYMDFMGPATVAPRKTSGDPLANRPATRIAKKPAVKSTPKPSIATVKPVKTVPAKPAKPSPKKDSDVLAKKAAAALSGSSLNADLKASKYTLSGKSPFLSSYNVEKRPLSDSIKEKKVEEIPKKNVYEKPKKSTEKPDKKSSKKEPVVVIDQPKNSSGLSLVIIIILTVILGAAVGAGAYFLLPK